MDLLKSVKKNDSLNVTTCYELMKTDDNIIRADPLKALFLRVLVSKKSKQTK